MVTFLKGPLLSALLSVGAVTFYGNSRNHLRIFGRFSVGPTGIVHCNCSLPNGRLFPTISAVTIAEYDQTKRPR